MENQVVTSGSENKKRSLDVVAGKQKTKEFLSPPAKKMKQARLPFAPKNSQMTIVPSVSPASKKRRVSSEEICSPSLKTGGSKPKKTPTKASATSSPKSVGKPSPIVIIVDDEEQVPTSSSEAVTPAPRAQSPFKPPPKSSSLDGFLQTTQQPQVSTSECVIFVEDEEDMEDCADEQHALNQSQGSENLDTSKASSAGSVDSASDGNDDRVDEVTQSSDGSQEEDSPESEKTSSGSLSVSEEKGKGNRGKNFREREGEAENASGKAGAGGGEEGEGSQEKEKQMRREKEEEEKEEKRKQKLEARQKKQEELEQLNAEKKKKLEEKQKQEDEKKKEEEEAVNKEEPETAMLFKSFFKKPSPDSTPTTTHYEDCGPFAAFQLRRDMVIAPTIRTKKFLAEEVKVEFDRNFSSQSTTLHYLTELSSGQINIGRSSRTKGSRRSMKDEEQDETDSDIEEVPSSSSEELTAKAKLLQFHENHRPPYFGTWRKRSVSVTGRKPFAKDKDQLDYEVDSDDEWEDPGESLSDSGTEDEDDNDSGDESDDGFFVPHGYLSEDEVEGAGNLGEEKSGKGQGLGPRDEKEDGSPEDLLIGCVWRNSKGSSERDRKALECFKAVPLVSMPILLTGVAKSGKDKQTSSRTSGTKGTQILAVHNKIRPVPKEAMPDLIRLVHGNIAGIKSLCREFKEFWRQKHTDPQSVTQQTAGTPSKADVTVATGQTASTPKSTTEKKTEEAITPTRAFSPLFRSAEDFEISKRQLEKKITKIAVRDKRIAYSKICWYVHDHILTEFNMESAPIPSTWKFITRKPFDPSKPRATAQPAAASNSPSQSSSSSAGIVGVKGRPNQIQLPPKVAYWLCCPLRFHLDAAQSAGHISILTPQSSPVVATIPQLTPKSRKAPSQELQTPKSRKAPPQKLQTTPNTKTDQSQRVQPHQVAALKWPFTIAKRASPSSVKPVKRIVPVALTPEPTPEKQKSIPCDVVMTNSVQNDDSDNDCMIIE
ncbi:putative chromatin assembly factor 1 subunit A-like [Apostichopus japonicus]|uniref:Putative chromatin assembly factor 1 subunit A-like n=1 Tax=Stichopus japonicus TaxID=307972 RepID=A0A2G8K859_STIJA|nr:putative chromatin assembly factor 1 subunit A-like [Apostichopus japonicus]